MLDLTFPDARYQATLTSVEAGTRFFFAWDDENPGYNFKCRTQREGPDGHNFTGPDNPPAVNRFYPTLDAAKKQGGDFRVNLTKEPGWGWRDTIIALNNADGGGLQRFNYWVNPNTAQFNTTGWAQMAYLGMSGNEIRVLERVGEWVRFETLRPTDWQRARSMSITTSPTLIHRFTCVTWDAANKVTKRIPHTGTPRGNVFYPLVTVEGSAWIPERFVVVL